MTHAMHRLAEQAHPAFPVTIYYAFKQAETDDVEGTASTGWDTFLDAVIRAGFAITGTWPFRTERGARTVGLGANVLASSIVLVCRRTTTAATVTRRELVAALNTELPDALTHLQRDNIAPVDLAQAAIGPGMAVFTRYGKVLDAEGKPLSVREALALINQTLDEMLTEQEGDLDADSRWALAWFEQSGFSEGEEAADEMKHEYTVVYQRIEDGWIMATVPELPGAVTQAPTIEEAREMIKEAVQMQLQSYRENARNDAPGNAIWETLSLDVPAA